jgi:hypothetical protein
VSVQVGPGFLSTLGIVFIVLKLMGYIDWSWWWVLAPFWAIPVILIVIILVVGILWLIAKVL